MTEKINDIQMLNFELMKKSSFNSFDGEKVVKDLIDHKDLWIGAIMDRETYLQDIDLIKLRDIADNYWNVDTLFILVPKEKKNEIFNLAKTWSADEIGFVKKEEAQRLMGYSKQDDDKILLRVWWD